MPNGKVLLNAVCFLPDEIRGKRQRVFFAIADSVTGPYKTLGPVINTLERTWESGENGHAAGVVFESKLHLIYQARKAIKGSCPWMIGKAEFDLADLSKLSNLISNHEIEEQLMSVSN